MKPCGQSHASRASLLINAASLRPSQRRPSTMRSSSESTSGGPVAPRSRGDCRPVRGQRASTVSTSATSARRRPGTAPRPEAARARASNSDVLQGEASITSRRRHRLRGHRRIADDQSIPSRTCDAAHPRGRVRGRRATVREVPCLGGKRAKRFSTATDDFVAATIAAYAVPTTRNQVA